MESQDNKVEELKSHQQFPLSLTTEQAHDFSHQTNSLSKSNLACNLFYSLVA